MEDPLPRAYDQAVLTELFEVLADCELDNLAGQSDPGWHRVGDLYCGHR
jgi:hypothetical protein